jgi:hypothetical membrane protein
MVQKVATKVFIAASLAFGLIGILMVLTAPDNDNNRSGFDIMLTKLLLVTVFIILPSFALSVAGKYLNDKS